MIDAHVHLWHPDRLPVPWIAGGPLDRPMLPEHLEETGVRRWIYVETDAAAAPLDEVAWVESLSWSSLVGIVADVDLSARRLRDDLAALCERPLVRGVRHLLQGLPDGALRDSEVDRGLRAVADADMTFDACVRWTQLGELAEALSSGGGGSVVLDHLGKPPVDDGIDSEPGRAWADALQSLAGYDGVSVKLSGLRAEATDVATLRANAPGFLRAALDLFGPERCLLGSDWPVSTGANAGLATSEWIGMVREATGDDGWASVAAGTAERVYRLC